MPLDPSYLTYAKRGPGLDHDWFAHRTARAWPRLAWPGGKPVALWLVVPVEHFPLHPASGPVRPTGALEPPAPNLWAYANRDYGNRIGIHRILRVLDRLGLKASAAIDPLAAARYPALIPAVEARGWEIMAHGWRADAPLHGGMDAGEEAARITEALASLRAAATTPVTGWLSTACSESFHTLGLLAARGVTYVADWQNDEMPYALTGPASSMMMLPTSHELSDRHLLVEQDRMVDDYAAAVLAAFARIGREAREQGGGRVLPLAITPWILGYPHRIAALARLLETITASGLVWNATGAEIIAACRAQIRSDP
ncbi:polysaccharide deacetylase [Novosphingobium album (ex Liu et al. 2023)]|uniref:Polysaccharide deacetylase n=1 Tax=Novosphingobium album (ex Liu et al. 2023) TaxID=3031130 RepID=A0ABT5WP50_9SPHN|nr:polysaccharide deacetylase [Novosphingobium album (ex Liu et al. 2023)]MDE8651521.1 polysaccharide deacetylase [Novosphingobium album (ex Liu et al. 2023)]